MTAGAFGSEAFWPGLGMSVSVVWKEPPSASLIWSYAAIMGRLGATGRGPSGASGEKT